AVVCMDTNGVLLNTWHFTGDHLTNIWNVASIASNRVILLDQEGSSGTQMLASVYLGAAGAYSLEWVSNLPSSIHALYSQDGFGQNGKAYFQFVLPSPDQPRMSTLYEFSITTNGFDIGPSWAWEIPAGESEF